MSRNQTARGREFNMQAFSSNQGDVTAVGNTSRNARGDLLGKGGKVIASAAEIANASYNNNSINTTQKVKLNPLEQEIGRKEVVGIDGKARWEISYADGSVEIINKDGAAAAPIDFDFIDNTKEL
jgi:hypothetical protein